MVQADNSGVRVQSDLQVQDVVDDVLQDFHLAHLPVLGDAGHQLLELRVAVVHVVQQAHRVVHRGLAPGDAQAVVRKAVFPNGPHWTEGFHADRARGRRDREGAGCLGAQAAAACGASCARHRARLRMKPGAWRGGFYRHSPGAHDPASLRLHWWKAARPSGRAGAPIGGSRRGASARSFRVRSQSPWGGRGAREPSWGGK